MIKSELEEINAHVLGELSRLSLVLRNFAKGDFSNESGMTEAGIEFSGLSESLSLVVEKATEIMQEKEILSTDFEQVEIDLQESRVQLQLIIDAAPALISYIDSEQKYRLVNKAYEKFFGKTNSEICGKRIVELLGRPDYHSIQNHVAAALRGEKVHFQYTLHGKKYGTRNMDANYIPHVSAQKVLGYFCFARETTKEMGLLKALQERENLFSKFFENEAAYCYMTMQDGLIFDVNSSALNTLGYKKDELIGRSITTVYAPESKTKVNELLHQWKKTGITLNEKGVIITKQGKRLEVIYNTVAVKDKKGDLLHAIFAQTDSTELERAGKSLKESEERLRVLWEYAPDGCYLTDNIGNFLDGNLEAERITQYKREELIGKSFLSLNLLPKSQFQKAAGLFAKNLIGKGTGPDEFTLIQKTGAMIPVEITTHPVTIKNKRCVLGIARDITERKLSAQKLEVSEEKHGQSQKMEALGILAGGIAHDFNNILTPIIGYAELALEGVPSETALHSDLQEIIKAGRRGKSLVNQILIFTRMKKAERSSLDVALILKESTKLLGPSLPSNINVQIISNSDAWVMGDPSQIHQIIMNLFSNAVDAMQARGGILKVSLSTIDATKEDAKQMPGLKTGTYVLLSVIDSGHGMDEATRKNIFVPFFTTKGLGKGTGMGLPVTLGIVKSHGGGITVYTEPGKGSTFNIYLPKSTKPGEEAAENRVELPSGSERILFVDDEESIVDLNNKLLASLGYHIIAVNNPQEALHIFQKQPQSFDLLITDIAMPEMPGDELARNILKIRPDLPVILISGFTSRLNEEEARAMGINAFLAKPVMKRTLAETVRSVLDKPKKEV
ncbi:MAG: PAS domain S-box protein [Candidatus Aminicenantaceae bacterium]